MNHLIESRSVDSFRTEWDVPRPTDAFIKPSELEFLENKLKEGWILVCVVQYYANMKYYFESVRLNAHHPTF